MSDASVRSTIAELSALVAVVELRRDGAVIGRGSAAAHLLKLLLLSCVRDGARRVRITRTDRVCELWCENETGSFEYVPPPEHAVNELYRLLSGWEPERSSVRWWNPLSWGTRSSEPGFPPCWIGEIEARIGGGRMVIRCDLFAHPTGASIVLDLSVPDDQPEPTREPSG